MADILFTLGFYFLSYLVLGVNILYVMVTGVDEVEGMIKGQNILYL